MSAYTRKMQAKGQKRGLQFVVLRNKGMTLQAIGDKMGCSRQRVFQVLQRTNNAV